MWAEFNVYAGSIKLAQNVTFLLPLVQRNVVIVIIVSRGCKMNKTKVRRVIEVMRIYKKSGELDAVPAMPEDAIDCLIEALEEITSEYNCEALRVTITMLSGIPSSNLIECLSKLRDNMLAVQVPKEIVYAYPLNMERHFQHYVSIWTNEIRSGRIPILVKNKVIGDDFGCKWHHFTGPKELVEFLRENNIPIKECE